MTTRKKYAKIYTPEELLAGAESFLMSDDPQMMRAVVLEAITALEAYVTDRVFSLLDKKIDPLLTKWIKDKTRMDFDSRLSVLTPVALGNPVDKGSILWNNYKKAKRIRNEVTHIGRTVSREEAKFVIDTVYEWLAFLGSISEVELALLGLKIFFEKNKINAKNELALIEIVKQYFVKTKASQYSVETLLSDRTNIRDDLILKFGDHTVLIETKLIKSNIITFIDTAINQTISMLNISGITRAGIIIFHTEAIPAHLDKVVTLKDGRISLVIIRIISDVS